MSVQDGAADGAGLLTEPKSASTRAGRLGTSEARDRSAGDASRFRPLQSKLRPPQRRLPLVQRRALVASLLASDRPLVVVSGAPGAGKSLLLAQWANAEQRPVAWLQLDASDNDPVVLLLYLATALQAVTTVDPVVFQALQLSIPPIRERVLPMLADALTVSPPFLLVLDDSSLLTNERCWSIIAALLDELPEGSQLAIGARVEPPLSLPRLRADGRLFEVRNHELALDRDEATYLLREHAGDVDDEVADTLLEVTEGWATGVYLGALAMRDRPAEEWLSHLRGDQREIASYLATEVLERQPEGLRTFLMETAVADRLSPALCHAITGRDDAGELLPRLAHDNLFVTPLDDHDEWFRYHRLFAELLRAELERRRPDDVQRLHENAAAWFLERGHVDSALHHLQAARDVDRAADLVAAEWTHYWDRGQAETVRRWLEAFDEEAILAHPALTLTAGWVFTAVGDARQAQHWARAACSARMDDSPSPDGAASLRSSQALLRATIAPDGVTAMREEAEVAAKLEARRGTSWHVDACQSLGAARWLTGAAQQAIRPLALAIREGAVFNPSSELAALGYLSLIAADSDEWETAREYERRAAARLAELGFGSHRRSLPMLLARARLMAHDRDCPLDDLYAQIDDILGRLAPHVWLRLLGEVTLGEVALLCGDLAQVDRRRAQAQRLLDQYPDAGILRRRVERLRKAGEQMRMIEPLTAAEARVLELLPTHLTEGQMAEELFVSRNTVKTHLRGLYRKLEVSSRADAVERARELGLFKA